MVWRPLPSILPNVTRVFLLGASLHQAGVLRDPAAHRVLLRRLLMVGGPLGAVLTLLAMSLRGGPHDHFLGYYGSLGALVLVGVFTGMFAVPLQVFLHSRPPAGDKGRMIATQNLLNWIGIFLSSGIYFAAEKFLQVVQWPPNGVFALTALFMLPVAVFFRPPADRA